MVSFWYVHNPSVAPCIIRYQKKGSLRKGSFHWRKCLESLTSLESLENGRILLCLPESGDSLESPNSLESLELRKLEKALAVRNSLLEKFSGKFRRCWKILHRFSGSTKCYPFQGLGICRQGKWLLENRPRLRARFSPLRPPQPSPVFQKK